MPRERGLLAGIRVLDLTTVLAGPFAGYQLSLLGADVIKVERPGGGDIARELGSSAELGGLQMGASFVAQNAGKRSVTVDLKSAGGKEVLTRLIADSDVLLENYRPGVLERLSFSWPRMQEINPRLVYCALSGFGASGPMAAWPAYDQIIQGLSGMCEVTGYPDGDPVRVGFPVCDTMGGLAAALAVCAGVIGRERTGEGCMLDVSMLETALTGLGWVVSDYLVGGRPPARHGNDNATSSPSGAFHTADDDLVIAANTDAQFAAICRTLERPDLLKDPRFATRADRSRHRAELRTAMEQTLMTAPAERWETALAAAGVPAGRVLTVADALTHAQVTARELVQEVEVRGGDSGPRPARILGHGIHVNGAVPRPSAPPPLLGEHTAAVLADLGYTPDEIRALQEQRAI
ncbi:MAG TPA: CoA transferase [Solirubrobacteraceae bacterium]|nr:CoA transferase [Solirubrobacteraceae bacterium]